ncbi:restriction endonuclease subunit S [Priestia aryabhattai]|uniref:restriction endonuclease subunit S n=1 Tax=Priestia aryabhattai TaxID=412384 RepID=UPI003D2B2CBC
MKSNERLKNITSKIGSGSTPRGGKSSYLESGPYKLIRSQNIYNHHYTTEGLAYITEEQAEKLKNVSLKEDDILINITGDSVARTTIVKNEMLPARVNQHVSIIRCKENLLNPYYLLAFLTSKDTQNYLLSLAQTGGTRAALTKGMLEQLEIPLVSYEVQKKIGNVLKMLNEKINVNDSITISLENLSRTLFKHWFIDFEFPNEQGQPYKSSGGEMVESDLGEIPHGWKLITIEDVCDANKGSLSKKDNWSYINYLDTSNITKNSIENIQFIDAVKDKIPSRAKRKVQANDIVYSTVRPNQQHYGIIKEPIENMVVSTGFIVLRSKGTYSNDLIYLWLTQKEVINNLQAIAEQSTSAYPSIKADDVLSMKILLPPKREIEMLTKIIEFHNKLIWNNQQENKRLSEIRDTLLPKLLSREIEMPNELVVK